MHVARSKGKPNTKKWLAVVSPGESLSPWRCANPPYTRLTSWLTCAPAQNPCTQSGAQEAGVVHPASGAGAPCICLVGCSGRFLAGVNPAGTSAVSCGPCSGLAGSKRSGASAANAPCIPSAVHSVRNPVCSTHSAIHSVHNTVQYTLCSTISAVHSV